MFEFYQNLLPEHIHHTRREKALQQQIAAVQKAMETLQKEIDLFKEIVMK